MGRSVTFTTFLRLRWPFRIHCPMTARNAGKVSIVPFSFAAAPDSITRVCVPLGPQAKVALADPSSRLREVLCTSHGYRFTSGYSITAQQRSVTVVLWDACASSYSCATSGAARSATSARYAQRARTALSGHCSRSRFIHIALHRRNAITVRRSELRVLLALKRGTFHLHYGALHCITLHSTKRARAATRARADCVQGRTRAARGVHE